MKKIKKKILALSLAVTCIMPNPMNVSAATNNTAVDIVAEDTKEVTTEVNEVLSGEVEGKEEVKTVTYTATSELTEGEAYVENAEATVTGNDWTIDDLALMPGENTITVTATTESGKKATEVIEVEYDMGEVAEIEDTLETEEGMVYSDNQLLVMFESDVSEERAEEIIGAKI